MAESSIYSDIAARTDGAFLLGVVGPVRTGKSSFIKRFMETLVIPHIENTYMRERARDELPQSGSGRTIMTAEPKFVPENAVSIRLGEQTELSVRLVDCVGYMVEGAAGQEEDGSPAAPAGRTARSASCRAGATKNRNGVSFRSSRASGNPSSSCSTVPIRIRRRRRRWQQRSRSATASAVCRSTA